MPSIIKVSGFHALWCIYEYFQFSNLVCCRYSYEEVEGIAQGLLKRVKCRPRLGIICGSGLGGLANLLEDKEEIPYAEIEGFPVSTGKHNIFHSQDKTLYLSKKHCFFSFPHGITIVMLWNLIYTLDKIFGRQHTEIFFLFFQKNRIWHFMHIVSTVCIKCQNLFSGKYRKNILVCCLLKILPRVVNIKTLFCMTYIFATDHIK